MILPKLWLIVILTIIFAADIRQMIIPDICILFMLPAAIWAGGAWRNRITAAFLVWGAYVLLAILSALLHSPAPIGMGDIKLFSAIGFISGPAGLTSAVIGSSLLGGIYAAALLILKKAQKKDQIPFGPFIAIAYAAYLASTSAM